jgi:hypothetical protein
LISKKWKEEVSMIKLINNSLSKETFWFSTHKNLKNMSQVYSLTSKKADHKTLVSDKEMLDLKAIF